MQKKSIQSRAFWMIIVGGMVTGMGNGSVFGAAMMCFLGRGGFSRSGAAVAASATIRQLHGFMDWCMLVFGFA